MMACWKLLSENIEDIVNLCIQRCVYGYMIRVVIRRYDYHMITLIFIYFVNYSAQVSAYLDVLPPAAIDPRTHSLTFEPICPSDPRQYRNHQLFSGGPRSRSAPPTKLVKTISPSLLLVCVADCLPCLAVPFYSVHRLAGLSSTQERTRSSCGIERQRRYAGVHATRSARMTTRIKPCIRPCVAPARTNSGSRWTSMETSMMGNETAMRHGKAATTGTR